MKYAILRTLGKQFVVKEGDKVDLDNFESDSDDLTFDEVLLIKEGDKARIGQPLLKGASVKAKVIKRFLDDKIIVFKYKRRKGYAKRKEHQTKKVLIEITQIA